MMLPEYVAREWLFAAFALGYAVGMVQFYLRIRRAIKEQEAELRRLGRKP